MPTCVCLLAFFVPCPHDGYFIGIHTMAGAHSLVHLTGILGEGLTPELHSEDVNDEMRSPFVFDESINAKISLWYAIFRPFRGTSHSPQHTRAQSRLPTRPTGANTCRRRWAYCGYCTIAPAVSKYCGPLHAAWRSCTDCILTRMSYSLRWHSLRACR